MRASLRFLLGLFVLLSLPACEKKPLYVDGAWVRLSPNPQSPSAAYFAIHGGSEPVTLRGLIVEAAVRAEMHDSQMTGGMMSMKPIDHLDIPANTTVKFQPGGKHVMLWGLNADAVAGGKLPVVLLFSNGDRIIVDAVLRKPGTAAPN